MADLSPVLERREDVGAPEQLDIGVGAVGATDFPADLRSESSKFGVN
jgi:hypothetical protein